jgi:outer membrane protein OmpA-like peptidoglycan-associated protein
MTKYLLSAFVGLVLNFQSKAQAFTLEDTSFSVKDTLAYLIEFDYNESVIPETAYVFLDKLSDLMFKYSNLKIEVANFMDFRGFDTYNFKLTKARAQSIVNYLVSKGISAERLVPVGYGERKQVYTEQKIASEKVLEFKNKMLAASRRTEFKILSTSFKL